MPFIHLHMTPYGVSAPCCVSKSCASLIDSSASGDNTLLDLVNAPKMKQLRLDMLAGVQNEECNNCYVHENNGLSSARISFNARYGKYHDEVVSSIQPDGTINDFKMRYYDIRFNNICNFKCRTCGSGFSSQWEHEDIKYGIMQEPHPKTKTTQILSDVINQIKNMEVAYFAGGEPLITEEHYIILEEMIRQERTDIMLTYNTNLSNLSFKDKDLISLWKHFKHKIEVCASIDHYGARAEYIRHGTDWVKVENNFKQVKQLSNVNLTINTVLSAFNYATLGDFYQYLIDNELYTSKSAMYSLYKMIGPDYLTSQILPPDIKQQGKQQIETATARMSHSGFSLDKTRQILSAIPWTESTNSWEQHKTKFVAEVNRLDSIRNENFTQTFPELTRLLDE